MHGQRVLPRLAVFIGFVQISQDWERFEISERASGCMCGFGNDLVMRVFLKIIFKACRHARPALKDADDRMCIIVYGVECCIVLALDTGCVN